MANTAEQIQEALTESILEPQSVESDAGSVTMPSAYNQLLLLKFLKNQEAQAAGRQMPKFQRIVNGNARGC